VDVRFGADNRLMSDMPPCPKSAINGLMQSGETSASFDHLSARARNAEGNSMPIVRAVRKLMLR
jgi:hypothetical protein